MPDQMQVIDLGRLSYEESYERQLAHHAEVLAARKAGTPDPGRLLLVEHDPVITITRRPGVAAHLLATTDTLSSAGVAVAETDRGGDITYHGPGQLVAYLILDLNSMSIRLHEYLRLLEECTIQTIARFGVHGHRDEGATGVWVGQGADEAKICAIGVRVRRWITLHGLALNVNPNLAHFDLIVPCGLVGRQVTSLERILSETCPSVKQVKDALAQEMTAQFANSGR